MVRLILFVFVNFYFLVSPLHGFPVKTEFNQEYEKIIERIKVNIDSKNMDSVFYDSKYLLEKSKSDSNTFYQAFAYKYLGTYYMSEQKIDSANICYSEGGRYFEANAKNEMAGELYIRLAYNQKMNEDIENAIINYKKGLNLVSLDSSAFYVGLGADHLGFIYFKRGEYLNALNFYQKGIDAFILLENWQNVGAIYNKVGLVYRKVHDAHKEEEAYKIALGYLNKLPANKFIAEVYINLSELYIDKGEVKKGFEILEKAKIVFSEINYQIGLCGYYLVHAYHHMESQPPNYQKVIEYAQVGIPIAEEYEDWRMFSDFNAYLGEAYTYTEQYDKAEEVLLKAYHTAKEHNLLPEVQKVTEVLVHLYDQLNQTENAYLYMKEFIFLSDSLQSAQKLKEFTEKDLSYKFLKERIKDSISEVQNMQLVKASHIKEIGRQKRTQLVFVFISLIIVVIALFLRHNSKKNKAQSVVLQEKNKVIEQSLEDKETLLKEVHHRVKNNLQLVSSLLELQSREIKDEKALESMLEGQERVRAMALIHQKLYQNTDLRTIGFKDYTELLIQEIFEAYSVSDISSNIEICDCNFDVDTAIPLGLIVNELITNIVKHAFKDVIEAQISVKLYQLNEEYFELIVQDNGVGMKNKPDLKKVKSLGLRLVYSLVKQLHGSIELENIGGSKFIIKFKDSLRRKQIQ